MAKYILLFEFLVLFIGNIYTFTVYADEAPKSGSIQAVCHRSDCDFYKQIDTFEAGKDRVRVEVKAIPDGVDLVEVKLKNVSGGRDYTLKGKDVTRLSGEKIHVEKGTYKVELGYRYFGNRGPKKLTIFVRWVQ